MYVHFITWLLGSCCAVACVSALSHTTPAAQHREEANRQRAWLRIIACGARAAALHHAIVTDRVARKLDPTALATKLRLQHAFRRVGQHTTTTPAVAAHCKLISSTCLLFVCLLVQLVRGIQVQRVFRSIAAVQCWVRLRVLRRFRSRADDAADVLQDFLRNLHSASRFAVALKNFRQRIVVVKTWWIGRYSAAYCALPSATAASHTPHTPSLSTPAASTLHALSATRLTCDGCERQHCCEKSTRLQCFDVLCCQPSHDESPSSSRHSLAGPQSGAPHCTVYHLLRGCCSHSLLAYAALHCTCTASRDVHPCLHEVLWLACKRHRSQS